MNYRPFGSGRYPRPDFHYTPEQVRDAVDSLDFAGLELRLMQQICESLGVPHSLYENGSPFARTNAYSQNAHAYFQEQVRKDFQERYARDGERIRRQVQQARLDAEFARLRVRLLNAPLPRLEETDACASPSHAPACGTELAVLPVAR